MSKQHDERLALVDRAWELCRNGKNREAIVLFSKLLSEHQISDLYNERGLCYSDLGESEAAIADFTKGLALDPADPDLFVNRGNAYLGRGDYLRAVQDYDAAISVGGEPRAIAHAHNGRGWAKWKLGQASAAISDFEAAVRLDDAYASPLHNQAIVLMALERSHGALPFLDHALRLAPEDVSTLCLRSDAFRTLHQFSKALDDCVTAHRIDGTDPEPRWRIAWLRSTSADSAIRDGDEALGHAVATCEATQWEDVSSLMSLAAAHGECGRFQEAIQWQEKVVALASSEYQDWALSCLETLKSGQPVRVGHTSQNLEELCGAMDEVIFALWGHLGEK